jgi:hypothetical protein
VNFDSVLAVANAALYEGYALYPYRASSQKNRVRFPFGGVYPAAYARAQTGADRCEVSAECLLRMTGETRLVARLRFLQLFEREVGSLPGRGAEQHAPEWQEVEEQNLEFSLDPAGEQALEFDVPGARRVDPPVGHGQHAPASGIPVVRVACALSGVLMTTLREVAPGVTKLGLRVRNLSDSSALERDAALPATFLSAQLLLGVEPGAFVSLLEPPAELAELAAGCEHQGLFPVLVGRRGSTNRLFLSPIVFYDYPEVSGESPGDLFDLTEIDEILTLRVQTLSEQEKREMRALEPRLARLLERAENLSPAELARLHGARRSASEPGLRAGARVRLRPKRRADILDHTLEGRIATVRSVERDFEDRTYLSVTVDDDPGQDLGILGQPGHRFFFHLDEVELISTLEQS